MVKAILSDAGVDDWLASHDATLAVDELRKIAQHAVKDVRSERLDVAEDLPRADIDEHYRR